MDLVYIGRRESIIVTVGRKTVRVLKAKVFKCEPNAAALLMERFNKKDKDPLFLEADKVDEYFKTKKVVLEEKAKARREEEAKDMELRERAHKKPVSMEAAAMQARKDKEAAAKKGAVKEKPAK